MKEPKLLKNYEFDEWMEAADGCEFCKARYEVLITYVDEAGTAGDIDFKITHEIECQVTLEDPNGPTTVTIGASDIAGWGFATNKKGALKYGRVCGHMFPSFAWTINNTPCVRCWRFIVDVPVTLFTKDISFNFCFECAQELDIFKHMHSGSLTAREMAGSGRN